MKCQEESRRFQAESYATGRSIIAKVREKLRNVHVSISETKSILLSDDISNEFLCNA
jgi:hypothetical protein